MAINKEAIMLVIQFKNGNSIREEMHLSQWEALMEKWGAPEAAVAAVFGLRSRLWEEFARAVYVVQ